MSTLRFLRTFVAVARHGSFSEAAEHVSLTQAAVSFQMRALENELNRPLFERSGRLAIPNAAGRQLLPEIQALLDQYDRLRAPKPGPTKLAGTATLGAIVSCMGPLSKGASDLKAQYPGLRVRLLSGKSGELADQVVAEELDAAIIVEPVRITSELHWMPLYEEPVVLLAPAGAAAQTPKSALERYPFLRFDRNEYTGLLVDRVLRQLHCPVNEFLELNSIETLVELVRQEVGVTLLPLLAKADWETDNTLKVMHLSRNVNTAIRRIGLIMRADYARPQLAGAFYATCSRIFNTC